LATANPNKAREIEALLARQGEVGIDLLPRPAEAEDVDETGETLEDNARLKARALAQFTGIAAVADDTGLEVDALDGEPGVHSARYAGEQCDPVANMEKLLAALDEAGASAPDQRGARFKTVAVLAFPDGSEIVATGAAEGLITDVPAGDGGFGYDPVFVPLPGDGRTFGQMSPKEKHELSHRGRAFRALAVALRHRSDGQV
jgi:XTP/dITP diphosphohydrolase